ATSFLWVVFLPNSFYLISDFIHLQELPRADILYDSLMFTAFVTTGVVLGFTSLFLVHLQLRRRFGGWPAEVWVGITLLLCSAAIYLGRDLRWNTWDILVNPGGLLFDISERLAHPGAYPNMVLLIVGFFVVLAGMYHVLWRGTRLFVRPAAPRAPARQD
ncbi:MAG TPA: DUF1361 domain-containing protein, partial [Verrucomicrobiae bacterium]|nr:DUF1361 domain-containing protein [Verrucomicrobiae bacterium]